MRIAVILCLFSIFFVPASAQSPSNTGFHGNGKVCGQNGSFMSDAEVNALVTEMLDRIGAKNRYVIVACPQLENCQATLFQGRPYILYNPDFLGRVKRLSFSNRDLPNVSGKDWETLTVLAHELGHHINNHILNPLPGATQHERELEADESAGFMIYLMGGSMAQASQVFTTLPEQGTYTHPGRVQRISSVRKGWESAQRKYPRPGPAPDPTPITPGPAPVRPTTWEHAEAFSRELVRMEGGSFIMGCTAEQGDDCYGDEKPAHPVTVSTFWLSRFEVTQRQWRWVMGSNPSQHTGCDDCPVDNVSWNDVQAFLRQLNEKTGRGYRLPTEAEWEYAARGGQKARGGQYSGGTDADPVGWTRENSGNTTHPVGRKPANELGLHDMTGNVFEWCQDRFGGYSPAAGTNPRGPVTGDNRVYRGGGWDGAKVHARVSSRYGTDPDYRAGYHGFRLASDAR